MNTTHRIDAPVEMKLECFEGQLLCDFVEELINELAGDRDVEALEHACEQLGEATAVAIWRRERVNVDLKMDEAIQLVDALIVRLEEEEWPEDQEKILSSVREKIVEEVTRRHTSCTVGDKTPDFNAVCVVS